MGTKINYGDEVEIAGIPCVYIQTSLRGMAYKLEYGLPVPLSTYLDSEVGLIADYVLDFMKENESLDQYDRRKDLQHDVQAKLRKIQKDDNIRQYVLWTKKF